MSGSGTLGLEQAILGHTLAFAPMVAPVQIWVALDLAPPAVSPSESAPGTEVSGGGYTRMPATFALVATPANIAANTTSIEFPYATSAWGTIGYFELWDSPIAGNRLYWGQLIDPSTELTTAVTVSAGDILRFSPGALGVQAATGSGGTSSVGAYLPLGGGQMQGALLLAHDPIAVTEAATKAYVDAHSGGAGGTGFLPLSGGALTGALTLVGNAAMPLQPVTLQQMNMGLAPLQQTISVVNVLDHGAKGDGTTDDSTAIQTTLSTYAGKAAVFIPDTGNPYMVGPLSLPTGTDLLLHGTLKFRPGNSNGVLVLHLVNNVTIRGHGTVDGNTTAQTANSAGINCGNCDNVSIRGITVQNAFNWPVNVTQSTRVRLDNVKMLNSGDSVEFAAACDNCWMTNCLIDGIPNDIAFAFYGGVTNSGAIGNVIRNSQAGIHVLNDSHQPAGCSGIVIADNIIYNCRAGITTVQGVGGVGSHEGVIISNNRCYNNGTAGVACADYNIDYVVGAVVVGNQSKGLNGGPAWGIYLKSNALQVNVNGNLVYACGVGTTTGVGLNVASANIVNASGNHFTDNSGFMANAIAGVAGLRSSFVGNYCDKPIALTLQSDTVLANTVGGRWTVNNQSYSTLPANAANDAAAATAGVPVGGMYRNASVLMVRTV